MGFYCRMTKAQLYSLFRETGLSSEYWGQFLFQYAECRWITWDQYAHY